MLYIINTEIPKIKEPRHEKMRPRACALNEDTNQLTHMLGVIINFAFGLMDIVESTNGEGSDRLRRCAG